MNKDMMNTIVIAVILLAGILPVQGRAGDSDSLRVTATGENNRLVINNAEINSTGVATDSLSLSGEISQVGENNSITIQAPDIKKQTTNKYKKTNNKIKSKPETGNMLEQSVNPETSGQHVTIKQTGSNNSVKINSR